MLFHEKNYNKNPTELTNNQLKTDVDWFKGFKKFVCKTAIPSWVIRFSFKYPVPSLML